MSKPFQGTLGILQLDTPNHYVKGDPANPDTYATPVIRSVAHSVRPENLVVPDETVLKSLQATVHELEFQGADYIIGASGLLSLYHKELQGMTAIPLADSALSLLSIVKEMYETQQVAVVTADRQLLTDEHLRPYGFSLADLTVIGLENCAAFRAAAIDHIGSPDLAKLAADTSHILRSQLREYPQVQLLISECTAAVPLHQTWRNELGIPVLDVFSLLELMYTAFR